MIKIRKLMLSKNDKLITAFAGVGLFLLILTFLFLQRTMFFQTMLIVSLIIIALPFIIFQYLEYKKAKEIEMYLPDFLRDVAESNRSGMPLARAIETATQGAYGALSKEMKRVSAQISWGIPLEEALRRFAERTKSKLVRQAILIIIESHKSGGEIADVLETVSTDIKTLKRIESERKSKLKVYLVSTYFIFFLFLGIIVALTSTFVPATPQLNEAASILGGNPSNLSEEDFRTFFFHLSLIQAFFAGIIGGQMGEGSPISGVKHSIILIVLTVVVFQFFIAPPTLSDRLADSIMHLSPTSSGVKTTPNAFTVFNSLTTQELVEVVKTKAGKRGLDTFTYMTPDDIEFQALACRPCERGEIVVSKQSIVVNKPTKIQYMVVGLGNGKYRVIIRGE